ncbi:MAG TPA: precorrin-3B C(17)-methyltransferase [Nitrospira sp.]|nr:precorrin-3B C(17)-methyltransferase [Nitrospira sp.]
MARVGRLAGAIVAETQDQYYLIGNTKMPCDWAVAGFEPPNDEIDALKRPFIRLSPCRAVDIAPPYLQLEVEDESLPRLLVETFLIRRTGSISERLWRLVTGQQDEDSDLVAAITPARWLGEIPPPIWQIVRDTVLRCT